MRPRLLDLFCGAGGAGMGYYRAGFDVVGVDIKPQPRYPFAFHQADALEFCREHGHQFDAIHASPPCQHYSESTPMHARADHPDMISGTREVLIAAGKPYIIENVENARRHLVNPIMLCGTMFPDLRVWWHRYFEAPSLGLLLSAASCRHDARPITPVEGSNARKGRGPTSPRMVSEAMGIDWMTKREMTQAIPPAYTEYLGRQLLAVLQQRAA